MQNEYSIRENLETFVAECPEKCFADVPEGIDAATKVIDWFYGENVKFISFLKQKNDCKF